MESFQSNFIFTHSSICGLPFPPSPVTLPHPQIDMILMSVERERLLFMKIRTASTSDRISTSESPSSSAVICEPCTFLGVQLSFTDVSSSFESRVHFFVPDVLSALERCTFRSVRIFLLYRGEKSVCVCVRACHALY